MLSSASLALKGVEMQAYALDGPERRRNADWFDWSCGDYYECDDTNGFLANILVTIKGTLQLGGPGYEDEAPDRDAAYQALIDSLQTLDGTNFYTNGILDCRTEFPHDMDDAAPQPYTCFDEFEDTEMYVCEFPPGETHGLWEASFEFSYFVDKNSAGWLQWNSELESCPDKGGNGPTSCTDLVRDYFQTTLKEANGGGADEFGMVVTTHYNNAEGLNPVTNGLACGSLGYSTRVYTIGGGLSTAVIIVIIIAALVFVIMVAVAVYCLRKKNRMNAAVQPEQV